MKRAFYSTSIAEFQKASAAEILGMIVESNSFTLQPTQRGAWQEEIKS